jgi:exopolyphosphatase/guanosine-5'-triphosphate,3'-diphosphate pyrophosphatase
MRIASLDLGTNTCLLLIAECNEGRVERVLHDEARVIRLGQEVHSRRMLHPDALIRAEACFADYSALIRKHDVDETLACATSAARDAVNGHELIDLGKKYDIPIRIISGEQEAEFTFAGTYGSARKGPMVIIDVGGGSTEFILGSESGIEFRQSIDIGAVRLTEMFVKGNPISEEGLSALRAHINEKLQPIRDHFPRVEASVSLVAVAGTPTTLACLDQKAEFNPDRIDGYRLTIDSLQKWIVKMASLSLQDRQNLPGMEPKRADVIVAGTMILMMSAECFKATSLEVSIRGMRYGVALELAQKKGRAHP